jgi:hypothetical protein
LPPLLTIGGMKRDNTPPRASSCSKKAMAVAVKDSPINSTASQPACEPWCEP